jgi:ferrous iron transport protein A
MSASESATNWPNPFSSRPFLLPGSGPRSMAAPIQPLTSLAVGAAATVAQIKVPPQDRGRLLEMGLLVGTAVELVRFAPMGDPVEIKVRGYHLTLRKHEADLILVSPKAA